MKSLILRQGSGTGASRANRGSPHQLVQDPAFGKSKRHWAAMLANFASPQYYSPPCGSIEVMQVPPAGVGPSGPDRPAAARDIVPPVGLAAAAARTTPVTGDSVNALLRELSQADLTRLLEIVESLPGPGGAAQVRELLRSAVEAVAEQNPGRALDQLKQLAILDPALAESLVSEPALASIRPGVEQLLSQLTGAAKLHAEGRLAEATKMLETASLREISARGVRPEIFVQVAPRLIEAGGLANYVRSAALSEAAIDPSRWAPALQAEPVPVNRSGADWRVPLRLLLSAWFALGIASAGLCWWLQYDHPLVVGGGWAGGLVVLLLGGRWRRTLRP